MKIKLSQTGRRLSVLIGILTTMIASGCASPDTAQTVARTKTTADNTVIIIFENGCPTDVKPLSQSSCTLPDGVKPPADGKLPDNVKQSAGVKLPADLVCVNRGKTVQWESDPAGTPFEVYFDPFVGRPYRSHGKDEKTSAVVVRRDSMIGKYKYSVLGLACSGEKPVLDPPIRVEY